ncbi:MAG: lytic transglycosylase domain-containing protein [Nitrospira sp.]|nr:MAG: lytic transglycosylase domain-containing protein [Nitrospira sp.]
MNTTSYIGDTNNQRSMAYGISGAFVLCLTMTIPVGKTTELTRYADRNGSVYALNAPDERMTIETREGKAARRRTLMADRRLARTIQTAAQQHQLSPALLWAVIKAESNFDPAAISRRGAAGLMQLMPSTAAFVKVNDPFNPADNIRGGAQYLRYLLNRFNDNLPLALAAYNAGEAHVRRSQDQIPPFPQTQHYVEKVLALYDAFQSGMAPSLT